jgi:nicotinate phosphoribosyltransferase
MFGNARAPVDAIGTGSFIPETYSETFATADVFMYDGRFGIKVGREKLFQGLKP